MSFLFSCRTVFIRSPLESDISSGLASVVWPFFLLDQGDLTGTAMISGVPETEVTPRKKCADITSHFPRLSGTLK